MASDGLRCNRQGLLWDKLGLSWEVLGWPWVDSNNIGMYSDGRKANDFKVLYHFINLEEELSFNAYRKAFDEKLKS